MTSKPRPSSPSVASLSWLHSDAADADHTAADHADADADHADADHAAADSDADVDAAAGACTHSTISNY